MRVKLIQGYNGYPVGHVLNLGDGVARLLIQNKKAVPVETDHDPDSDGKDEGGEGGEKKAFAGPPKQKRSRK